MGGARDFPVFKNVQTRSGAHSASYSGFWGSFLGRQVVVNRLGMKLTTHLHLVLRLRMSRATSVLPLYALIARKGRTSSLPFTNFVP
jgi:hypothetical protein